MIDVIPIPAETKVTPLAAVRKCRIALAGCGMVGSELLRLLQAQRPAIEAACGVRPEIVGVLVRDVRKSRAVQIPDALYTSDVDTFLETPADIVVEALGGIDPAERIARDVLGRGGHFVTANKALISAAGADLVQLARHGGGAIDFEAAVGGGVPVVRALRDALPQAPVQRIRAILNGTTNYILTLIERGVPFQRALQEAQRNGFAEADPTRDLDGRDTADKLRILAWLAWRVPPQALALRCRGILPYPDRLAGDAAAVGGSVRVIAECARLGDRITASVEPVIVHRDSAFARTVDEQNHVSVDLFGWNGPVALSGPGAGGLPTAAALLSDILRPGTPLAGRSDIDAVPAVDDRAHAWVISMNRGRARLFDDLAGYGLQARQLRADGARERLLITNCRWSRLGALVSRAETRHPEVLVTRVDLPEIECEPGTDLCLSAVSC